MRNAKICFNRLGFALVFAFLTSNSLNAQGFLKRLNRDIVNDAGSFYPRGVNLGGWLVPEGYIIATRNGNVNSPTQIRAAVRDLLGTDELAATFFKNYQANFYRKVDIADIANRGFNHVRLPFHYNMFYNDATGLLKNDGFVVIDSVLSWCKTNKIYLILDMHAAPGSQNTDGHSDSQGTAELWSKYDKNKPITAKIWKHIADHFKNEPWIGGYDLINEPVITNNDDKWKLLDLFKNITDSIRRVDTKHLIFAEGNYYASSLWELIDNATNNPWDDNLSFSIHGYWTPVPFPGINDQTNIAKRYNVPLWLGETGENSNHWIGSIANDLKSRNIGMCFWSYKKAASINTIQSVKISNNYAYQAVVNYWSGSQGKPTPSVCQAAMNNLTQSLLLENCNPRPDVSDALTRADYLTKNIPYKPLFAPGVINATDFDMGANDIATANIEFQTTNGLNNFVPWNKGWEYRNDAISIEQPEPDDFNLFKLNKNQWMKYTFTAQTTGNYALKATLASAVATGKCRIELDGIAVATVAIPNTRGVSNWETSVLTNLKVTSGVHTLKFIVDTEGFNLKNFEWTLLTPTEEIALEALPKIKIYPSVAKNFITIENAETVEKAVLIFDSTGRIIQKRIVQSGETEINISDWATGLYILTSGSLSLKFVRE